MTDVKQLATLMKELEDQVLVCMGCGLCQSICPVYKQTGKEVDVARGKLVLVDGFMEAMLTDVEETKERLQKCLLCGSCEANCPTGGELSRIFLQARTILTGYSGLSQIKKVIFRGLLSKPKLFDNLLEWSARVQGLFTRNANETVRTSCAAIAAPVIKDRHFRSFAPKPFHKMVGKVSHQLGNQGFVLQFLPVGLLIRFFRRLQKQQLGRWRIKASGYSFPKIRDVAVFRQSHLAISRL